MNGIIAKSIVALGSAWRSLRREETPRLVMTLLVKNEGDILEANLKFHKAMGVDTFIITDNNSTDETPDIIERYRQMGWVSEVIRETGQDYRQKQWVDRMVRHAKRMGATWVINADADEMWLAPTGNLKDEIANRRDNVLRCEVRNMYPREDRPFVTWDETTREVENPDEIGLSRYSIYNRKTWKVAHRTAGYVEISMGNHKVKMLPRRMATSDIIVYHYNIRGEAMFTEKMRNGGEQLARNPNRHGGRHWRYFYDLLGRGMLHEEYGRVTGAAQYEKLRAMGKIVKEERIAEAWRNIMGDNEGNAVKQTGES